MSYRSRLTHNKEVINQKIVRDDGEFKYDTPIKTIVGYRNKIDPELDEEYVIHYDSPSAELLSSITNPKNKDKDLISRLSDLSSHHTPKHHKKPNFSRRHTSKKHSSRKHHSSSRKHHPSSKKHYSLPSTHKTSKYLSSPPITFTPPKSFSRSKHSKTISKRHSIPKNKSLSRKSCLLYTSPSPRD